MVICCNVSEIHFTYKLLECDDKHFIHFLLLDKYMKQSYSVFAHIYDRNV